MRKLTPKQQRFVEEYMVDLNATQAAIRAGYSVRSAVKQGCRMLTNADIAQAISEAREAQSKRVQVSADDVIKGFLKIATSGMQEIPKTDFAGNQVVDRNGKPVWKMLDAMNANKSLELLGKHLGMFVDKKEITGKDGGPLMAGGVLVVPAVDTTDDWIRRAEQTVIEQKAVKARFTGDDD